MVRRLTPEEVKPVLVSVWEKVQPEINYRRPLDSAHLGGKWTILCANPRCCAYGLFDESNEPTGLFLGLIFEDMHFPGLLHGSEYFWAATKASRSGAVRLLKAFEADCKLAGCESVSVGAMADHDPDRRRKLYGHLGYAPHSEAFFKKLE